MAPDSSPPRRWRPTQRETERIVGLLNELAAKAQSPPRRPRWITSGSWCARSVSSVSSSRERKPRRTSTHRDTVIADCRWRVTDITLAVLTERRGLWLGDDPTPIAPHHQPHRPGRTLPSPTRPRRPRQRPHLAPVRPMIRSASSSRYSRTRRNSGSLPRPSACLAAFSIGELGLRLGFFTWLTPRTPNWGTPT